MRIRFLSHSHILTLALVGVAGLATGGCKSERKAPSNITGEATTSDTEAPAASADESSAEPPDQATAPSDTAAALPPDITPEDVAMAERKIAHVKTVAAAALAHGDDCKKAAAAMTEAANQVRADMEKIVVVEKAKRKDERNSRWFDAKYADVMQESVSKIMALAQTCGDDPDFQEAMKAASFN